MLLIVCFSYNPSWFRWSSRSSLSWYLDIVWIESTIVKDFAYSIVYASLQWLSDCLTLVACESRSLYVRGRWMFDFSLSCSHTALLGLAFHWAIYLSLTRCHLLLSYIISLSRRLSVIGISESLSLFVTTRLILSSVCHINNAPASSMTGVLMVCLSVFSSSAIAGCQVVGFGNRGSMSAHLHGYCESSLESSGMVTGLAGGLFLSESQDYASANLVATRLF